MISPEKENVGNNAGKLQKTEPSEAWCATDSEVTKIPISQFQKYYDALFLDDADVVKDIIKAQKDPSFLLNSEFDFQHSAADVSRKVKRVYLPLHIAVANGSCKVAEAMLAHGANSESQDVHGRNILHNLVTMTTYVKYAQEEMACSMVPWLIEKFGIDVVYKWSRQENKDGLRPLEYATQQNALKLMKTMLETKGLYVHGDVTKGDTHFLDLDVTEYETSERHSKSPLNMLAYLDSNKMGHPETSKVILSPVISSWISAKKRTDTIPLIIWILFRLFVFSVFMIVDVDVRYLKDLHGENASYYICEDLGHVSLDKTSKTLLILIILFGMAVSFILHMISLIRDKKQGLGLMKHNIFGRKAIASNQFFYQVVEITYCLVLAGVVGIIFDIQANGLSEARILISDMLRLFMPLLIIWLLIYFLQLVPYLDSFIISIQGMLGDTARFFILFLLILLPFAHSFETFILNNSEEGCIADFDSILSTSYTLFKMMLNMHDLSQHQIAHIGLLYMMHVVFVFIVAVLLLNFLIAIMASSASQIENNVKVSLAINQISILNECEKSSFWARPWFYPRLNKFGFGVCGEKVLVRFEVGRLDEIMSKHAYRKPQEG